MTPSVEDEEIEDELDYHTSVPPRNPQHILEATNGSDDDVDTPAPPHKSTTSTRKPIIMKRRPSVEVEEIEDESDYCTSVPPHNPRHVLEAADGSDNDIEEDPAPSGNEEGEAPEESDEAKLGCCLALTMWMAVRLTYLNVQLGGVKVRMGGTFIDIWTRAMQSQQVACVGMQQNVGVLKR
ncbi:hypothetical protein BYT27DRAFT_7219084 [Phlegmacium glaucopus]|nr:hypothetical protein BYT27DRAFT_7219084 [Phlegmacium glaucopus]